MPRCDEPGCTAAGTFVITGIRDDTGSHDYRLCEEHAPKDSRGAIVQLDKNGRPMRDKRGRLMFGVRGAVPSQPPGGEVDVGAECERLDATLGDLLR